MGGQTGHGQTEGHPEADRRVKRQTQTSCRPDGWTDRKTNIRVDGPTDKQTGGRPIQLQTQTCCSGLLRALRIFVQMGAELSCMCNVSDISPQARARLRHTIMAPSCSSPAERKCQDLHYVCLRHTIMALSCLSHAERKSQTCLFL